MRLFSSLAFIFPVYLISFVVAKEGQCDGSDCGKEAQPNVVLIIADDLGIGEYMQIVSFALFAFRRLGVLWSSNTRMEHYRRHGSERTTIPVVLCSGLFVHSCKICADDW